MRILVVSPYSPARDGIAAYALQTVATLRAEGHDVEVLSPGPSAAHHHLDLRGWRGPLALAKRVRDYDRVVVQFHPDVFYSLPGSGRGHVAVSLGLLAAFKAARHVDLVVHELDYDIGRRGGAAGRAMGRMLSAATRVMVHTEPEATALHEAFGVPRSRIETVDHGAHFLRRTSLDPIAARARFGIDDSELVFLAIGFIQPHKGFDRAIAAFAQVRTPGCRLEIVGSVRVEEREFVEYLEQLQTMAATTPGVTVRPAFVSDDEFDAWLVAADVVVLPYRRIWSSGVLERAALYERPVIATSVGGLPEQARANTVVVDDDDGLVRAMRAVIAERLPASPANGSDWTFGQVDRETVMAEIRARAAADRGGAVTSTNGAASAAGTARVSAPLRRLPSLEAAAARSVSPLAALVKRVARRLTAWQIDPIVEHVNRLQQAAVEATERAASAGDDDGNERIPGR
jgi:glycosyltransferase involved in cell wall biosynthesis